MTTYMPHGASCPSCKGVLNASTAVSGTSAPNPGDLSVCDHCATLLRFDAQLMLVSMTDADLAELDQETVDLLNDARVQVLQRIRRRPPACGRGAPCRSPEPVMRVEAWEPFDAERPTVTLFWAALREHLAGRSEAPPKIQELYERISALDIAADEMAILQLQAKADDVRATVLKLPRDFAATSADELGLDWGGKNPMRTHVPPGFALVLVVAFDDDHRKVVSAAALVRRQSASPVFRAPGTPKGGAPS